MVDVFGPLEKAEEYSTKTVKKLRLFREALDTTEPGDMSKRFEALMYMLNVTMENAILTKTWLDEIEKCLRRNRMSELNCNVTKRLIYDLQKPIEQIRERPLREKSAWHRNRGL
jgi:hypothetical protein